MTTRTYGYSSPQGLIEGGAFTSFRHSRSSDRSSSCAEHLESDQDLVRHRRRRPFADQYDRPGRRAGACAGPDRQCRSPVQGVGAQWHSDSAREPAHAAAGATVRAHPHRGDAVLLHDGGARARDAGPARPARAAGARHHQRPERADDSGTRRRRRRGRHRAGCAPRAGRRPRHRLSCRGLRSLRAVSQR